MADREHGHAWRQLCKLVLATPHLACGICRQPIDRRVPWPHPKSPSVDMIVPFARGGSTRDLRNLRAAHLGCNSSRGARTDRPRRWVSDDTP